MVLSEPVSDCFFDKLAIARQNPAPGCSHMLRGDGHDQVGIKIPSDGSIRLGRDGGMVGVGMVDANNAEVLGTGKFLRREHFFRVNGETIQS